MVSKLFFLVALVIFLVLVVATISDPGKWMYAGFAAVAAGLLTAGFGPELP